MKIFNEDKEEVNESNIVKQITRLTVTFANRFSTGTANDRVVLSTAINILSQAMLVATISPTDALRLYTTAMKTASLAHGKSTK